MSNNASSLMETSSSTLMKFIKGLKDTSKAQTLIWQMLGDVEPTWKLHNLI
jgi:hypothetical protein